MLRRQPTRVEVGQNDRDELDALRKERAKKDKGSQPQTLQYEHVEIDRNLPSKNVRLGLTSSTSNLNNSNN